ncbi:BON domain-containing protein [Chitiniphilus eburneus]|uniref:BON domain-containing protein n=1 Tax=Chitiniphilus eburneus TaxID=2571148 RepID=A0A4U0PPE7_9NEIS|nr:BON domain-containing protein [Chitiniphilus eburneus]TJZ70057.1 BON domain-containing protein [Chitiniphilus eburneus]
MNHRTVTLALAPLLLAGLLTACGKKEEPVADNTNYAASAPAVADPTPVEASPSMAESAAAATASAADSAGNAVSNAALTAKVKAALAADVSLKTLTVNVDSNGNHVSLTGEVENEAQRTQAEQVARGVEGVSEVTNNLTLKAKG